MTSSIPDFRNMPSKQRIAALRELPRATVQEADGPKCECHTFTLWRTAADSCLARVETLRSIWERRRRGVRRRGLLSSVEADAAASASSPR
jgi:hypothetical protein